MSNQDIHFSLQKLVPYLYLTNNRAEVEITQPGAIFGLRNCVNLIYDANRNECFLLVASCGPSSCIMSSVDYVINSHMALEKWFPTPIMEYVIIVEIKVSALKLYFMSSILMFYHLIFGPTPKDL